MRKILLVSIILVMLSLAVGCGRRETTSSKENEYTQNLMKQADAAVGFPEVTNFFERSQLKEIYELRDNPDLVCYWYTKNNMSGKWVYQGECIGYGIPYSTQLTQPDTLQRAALPALNISGEDKGYYEYYEQVLPQAEPNGLYSTGSTSATWILSVNDKGDIKPVYEEENVTVTQIKIEARRCEEWSLPSDY